MGISSALKMIRDNLSAWKAAADFMSKQHPRHPDKGHFVSTGTPGAIFHDEHGNPRDHATGAMSREQRAIHRQRIREARKASKESRCK